MICYETNMFEENTIEDQWSEAELNTDEQDTCEFSRNSGTGYPD